MFSTRRYEWLLLLQKNSREATALQSIMQGSNQYTVEHALRASELVNLAPQQAARLLRIGELTAPSSAASLQTEKKAWEMALSYWSHKVIHASSIELAHLLRQLGKDNPRLYNSLMSEPAFFDAVVNQLKQSPQDAKQQLFDVLTGNIDINLQRLEQYSRGIADPVSTPDGASQIQRNLPYQVNVRWPSSFWGNPSATRTLPDGTTLRVYSPGTVPDSLRRIAALNLALGNPADYPGLNSRGIRDWINNPQPSRTFGFDPETRQTEVITATPPQVIDGLPPEPSLRDIFSSPNNYVVIAEPATHAGPGGKFRLGTIVVQLIDNGRTAVIGRLQNAQYSVAGQAYNRELGPLLIRESVALSDRLGAQLIRVEADDARRMRLYRTLGLQVVDEVPNLFSNTTYIMETDLGNSRFRDAFGLSPR
jgi:hypothetical protein